MSQGNNTTISQGERLRVLNDELATLNITTIVIIAVLMVIGLVGNSVACYIFSFRLRMSTQHFLIIWLAVFDLLSCSVAMPAEIVDIRYFIMYPDETACRLLRFINHFCSYASILTLIVISVDRFRKVCRPLKQQMRPKHAKIAMTAVIVVGVAYALPAPFVNGLQTIKTREPGVYGYDCSTSDKFRGTLLPLLYNAALFLTFLFIFIVLTVIYVKIWREMKRHIRYMSKFSTLAKDSLRQETLSSDSATGSSGQFYELAEKPGRQSGCSARFRAADKPVQASGASVTDTESLTDAEENSTENRSFVGVKQSELTARRPIGTAGSKLGANAGSLTEYPLQTTDENFVHEGLHISGYLVNISEISSIQLVERETYNCGESKTCPLLHPYLQDGSTSESNTITSTKEKHTSSQQGSTQDTTQVSDSQRGEGEKLLQLVSSSTKTMTPAVSNQRGKRESESDAPAREIGKGKSAGPGRGAVKTHKATVIAMSVTAVFFLSFLPHLSLVTARIIKTDLEAGLQGVPLVAYNIFLRSFFINSVANPIIYGVLNQAFRAQCLSLFRRMCSCRK